MKNTSILGLILCLAGGSLAFIQSLLIFILLVDDPYFRSYLGTPLLLIGIFTIMGAIMEIKSIKVPLGTYICIISGIILLFYGFFAFFLLGMRAVWAWGFNTTLYYIHFFLDFLMLKTLIFHDFYR